MDVLTPHTLDEVLRLKAELLDARFVQGGTDVLVELNFDRSRPRALINLNEVAELRGFTRENDTFVLGSGLTYVEAMRDAVAEDWPSWRRHPGPSAHPRSATGARSAATSERHLLQATRCRRCSSRMRRCRSRASGEEADPLRDFLLGVKKNALAPDEIITAVRVEPSRGNRRS